MDAKMQTMGSNDLVRGHIGVRYHKDAFLHSLLIRLIVNPKP